MGARRRSTRPGSGVSASAVGARGVEARCRRAGSWAEGRALVVQRRKRRVRIVGGRSRRSGLRAEARLGAHRARVDRRCPNTLRDIERTRVYRGWGGALDGRRGSNEDVAVAHRGPVTHGPAGWSGACTKEQGGCDQAGNTDFMRLTSLCCRSIKAVNVGPAAGFPVCRGATFSTRLSGLSDNPAPSHGSAQGRRPSAP